MELGIRIKAIVFDPEWGENPLPYGPSFYEWTDHVKVCVPCARVDQLAKSGQEFNPMELCEGGAVLQLTVTRRMDQQRKIALWN